MQKRLLDLTKMLFIWDCWNKFNFIPSIFEGKNQFFCLEQVFTCFHGFFSLKICQFQETDSKVYFKDISKNFLTGKNSAGNSYIKLVYNIEPYLQVILRINCSASVAKVQLITFAIWNFDVGIWFSMLTDGSNGGIRCRCNCRA